MMASLRANGRGVPFTMPVPGDGIVNVPEQLLSLKFHFRMGTMYVEEEIVDESGEVTETVFQMQTKVDDAVVWKLRSGTFRVFGISDSQISTSSAFVTPRASASTVQIPVLTQVKVESPVVQLLSDSEDDICPVIDLADTTTNPFLGGGSLGSTRSLPPRPFSRSPSISSGRPPLSDSSEKVRSIIDLVRDTASRKGSKAEVLSIDFDCVERNKVKYLPPAYDGDVIFELPPLPEGCPVTYGGAMDGMGKQYDGHTWCRTITTNVKNDYKLTFRKSVCPGHLQCSNADCDYITRNPGKVNSTEWAGVLPTPYEVGCIRPPNSSLVCKICRIPPICLATCGARIFYVYSSDKDTSRAAIHLGRHVHPVSDGVCLETLDRVYECVAQEVQRTPTAKASAIVMAASKTFLSDYLFRSTPGHLQGASLDSVMDKFVTLSSANARNMITGAKKYIKSGMGPIDSIMALKEHNQFKFIHDSRFPGQAAGKVFVFKMSVDRPGSGVDLVKRMQPGGDLEDSWVMFDHVKRVPEWTTIAAHVYDSKYCKVMTIALCDMQSEDADAQELFWTNLNSVMSANGVPNTNFKGFMADSAQANWHAVRKVYGNGDPSVPMENRERTCLFHWTLCLQRATSRNIKLELQDQHKELCRQWKDAKSQEEAEMKYNVIRGWWVSSGATTEAGRRALNDWMAFWHYRYRQWGGAMILV